METYCKCARVDVSTAGYREYVRGRSDNCPIHDPHAMAGRMVERSGAVTFCRCGLAFFEGYDGGESNESRRAAAKRADGRHTAHRTGE